MVTGNDMISIGVVWLMFLYCLGHRRFILLVLPFPSRSVVFQNGNQCDYLYLICTHTPIGVIFRKIYHKRLNKYINNIFVCT